MKPYRLFIFDFDGTLIDTLRDIRHYANEVLSEQGYAERSLEEVKKAVGWGVHELFKKLAPDLDQREDDLERAVQSFKKRYDENPTLHAKPYPNIIKALNGPLGPYPKAIVTNKPQDITEHILRKLNLSELFQYVIGLHAGYPPKPDPASVEYIIRASAVPREQVIYIGDSRVDAEVSRRANIDFAWVNYGYDTLNGDKCDYEFSDPMEWKSLV